MLTSDLVRYEIDDAQIRPRYLTRRQAPRYLPVAADLIRIFANHVGMLRHELEQDLEAFEADRTDYKVLRGLIKMLDSYAEYEPVEDVDYPRLRHELFEFAQAHRPIVRHGDLIHKTTREEVLSKFEEERGSLPHDFYGDLPEKHRLVRFASALTPEDLARRYNLALAQGLLYRCVELRIHINDSYQTVFRYLKLAQLMHRISAADPGYKIVVDGPYSLFSRTQKYGVNLARFLPGLLLAEKWRMRALINTESGTRIFDLDQSCGLTSYYKKEHPFDSAVEESFFRQFCKRHPDWDIEREPEIVDLGGTVFIPDFKLRRPDGRKFLLEIVGFWTPEYLEKKTEKLKQAKLDNLLIAVGEKLNCAREQFAGKVITYKTRLKVKDVMQAIEEL